MDDPMHNDQIIDRFDQWMRASYRQDGTIRLRLSHVRQLARRVQLTLVQDEHIEKMLADKRHLSPETRHSMLASYRLFYRWALAKRLVLEDPTATIDGIRVPARMPKVAPDEAIRSALGGASARDRALVMLARYGCLRLTEFTTLHMRQRDGDRLLIRGKGDKERIVYANDDLLAALRTLEHEQPNGYYFPGVGTGSHLHPQAAHKIVKRLTGWNPHALRHAGATAAYRSTGNLRAVQDMLGHASLATTQRYLHLDDEDRRAVARATIIGSAKLAA